MCFLLDRDLITVGANPRGIAITPDQSPVARFTTSGATVGAPVSFNASTSTVAVGSIVSYSWKFGDGTKSTTSVPTTTHAYAAVGAYTATVTETDSAGTSTAKVFTGQTMSRNGRKIARANRRVTIN